MDNNRDLDLIRDIIFTIVERRKELGLSQRKLAKLSGVKQEAICRIENLKNMPQIDTLIKLIIPLNLNLSVTPNKKIIFTL